MIEATAMINVNIVIMQVMPKYTFDGNVVIYNITSVRNNIKYNISDISAL